MKYYVPLFLLMTAKVINRRLEDMPCAELKPFSTPVAFCFPLCWGLLVFEDYELTIKEGRRQ